MSDKITWKDLFSKVETCHKTVKFKTFSEMDNCIADAKLLLDYTPEKDSFYNLREATSLMIDRIKIEKGIYLREKNNNFKNMNEEALIKERLAHRLSKGYENQKWDAYIQEVEYKKNNPKEDIQQSSGGFEFYTISMVLLFFAIVFIVNLFLSGKLSKRTYIFKLKYLGLEQYAQLIEKELAIDDQFDKKRSLKNGDIQELTLQENIYLERIYKNETLIDAAYTLLKNKKNMDEDQQAEVDVEINEIKEKFEQDVIK